MTVVVEDSMCSTRIVEDFKVEIGETRGDVKTFVEKFRSDVEKKQKDYQSYVKNFAKEKLKKSKF